MLSNALLSWGRVTRSVSERVGGGCESERGVREPEREWGKVVERGKRLGNVRSGHGVFQAAAERLFGL